MTHRAWGFITTFVGTRAASLMQLADALNAFDLSGLVPSPEAFLLFAPLAALTGAFCVIRASLCAAAARIKKVCSLVAKQIYAPPGFSLSQLLPFVALGSAQRLLWWWLFAASRWRLACARSFPLGGSS